MENNLHSVSYSLDSALLAVNAAITDVAFSRDVLENIQKKAPAYSYDYMLVNDYMKSMLNKTLRTDRLIQSVYLVSSDFDYFCKSEITRTYSREELLRTEWSQLFPVSKDNVWYVVPGENNITEKTSSNTLTMVKRIYNFSYDKIVGYVSANIGFPELKNYLEQFQFGQTGYLILCNQEGKIIYHPDSSLNGTLYDKFTTVVDRSPDRNTFVENNTIVTYYLSGDSGLIYIAYIPVSEVIVPAITIQKTVTILFLMSILLSLFYAGLISSRIYAPIKVLITHMKQAAGGDTSVRIHDVRSDEMGRLYENFNDMISRIDQLIQTVYEQKAMTDELRIKNLQIQLNPHFLYNILDCIHWAARENDMDDVCQMTFLLSRYFQKNLDNGRDWSTVEVIASAMQAYMELQRIRYEDKLVYEIFVDPSISECLVPKYLFQPLLENAILHGIEKRSTTGFCRVSWTREGSNIHFCVEDNGPGITKEKLMHIRSSIEKREMDMAEYFAFRNINAQLQLLYGETYHLMIDSTPDAGTKVEFYLPCQNKEENHV